jgi:hypothetical protein
MSVWATSNDNVTTSDCLTAIQDSGVVAISLVDTTGTSFDGVADLTAFTSDGFTLSWTGSTATTYTIHYMAFGGTDITNVKVGVKAVGTAATGNKSYTGVGFQPDFLLTLNDGHIKASTISVDENTGNFGLGISAMKSTSERWAISTASEGGRADSDTWRLQQNTKCFSLIDNTTGTLTGEADFVSFDSDGFTWNYTTTGTNITNSKFIYLAIKGGVWDVGDHTIPATNSTVTTNTNSSATLKGVMLFNIGSTTALLGTVSIHNLLTIGGTDGTRQSVSGYCDLDAAATMINTRIQNTTNCVFTQVSAATAASSTYISGGAAGAFNTSSFPITYTSSDTNARVGNYFAVSESSFTLFDRPISDTSITISESLTRVQLKIKPISETTITIGAGSVTRLQQLVRTIADPSITVGTGIVTRLQSLIKLLSDPSVTVGAGAVLAGKFVPKTISETAITVGAETVTRLQQLVRAISEPSISAIDSIARLQSITKTIAETAVTVGIGAVSISKQFVKPISETAITVGADSVTRLQILLRLIADTSITVGAGSISLWKSLTKTISDEPAVNVGAGLATAGKLLFKHVTEPIIKWYYSVFTRKM